MFKVKPEQAERIKRRYKLSTMAEEVGKGKSLITLYFNGTRSLPKTTAYAITKWIDSEAEIEDFFVRTDEVE